MFIRGLLFFFLCLSSFSFSQIAVTNAPPYDTEQGVVDGILVGGDLETSNFSSVGFANGIGYFDGFNANIGFEEGVILSTGGLNFVTDGFGNGSAVSGDDDLEDALSAIGMTGFSVNNVTILEFDFVANSESMEFNYVFGSMEYTSYTCSQFNDIFGFFLSGPGIQGPYTNDAVNIALVPDPEGAVDYDDWVANNTGIYTTTPVAINTINDGEMTNDPDCNDIDPNFEDYNIFWYDNDYGVVEGVNDPPEPEFTVEGITGFTAPLTAVYNGLVCGETYHIKLAIADCWDSALNSVVFIEANSFVSPSVVVDPISNITGPIIDEDPTAIYEGCASAQLQFTATDNGEEDILLEVLFGGTAIYGVDYEVTYNGGNTLEICENNDGVLSQCVNIPAGENVIYLDLLAFYDGDNSEVFEDLQITINAVDGICQTNEVSISEVVFNVYDQVDIQIDTGDPAVIECFGDQVTLSPDEILGGYIFETNDYTYEWYDEDGVQVGSGSSLTITSEADTEYQLVVYDDCQDQQVQAPFNVQVIQYPDLVVSDGDYIACDDDVVVIEPEIEGGSENYSYIWPDSPLPCDCTTWDFEFELDNGPIQFVELTVYDNCTGIEETIDIMVEIDELEPPTVGILELSSQFCPGDEINLEAEVNGGSTYTYEWIGSDEIEYMNNMATVSPEEDANYIVIVTDECNGDTTMVDIDIDVPIYAPPTFVIEDVVGCPGETLEIAVQDLFSEGVETDDDYSFLWSNGETSQSIFVDVQEQTTFYSVEVSDLCDNVSEVQEASVSISVAPAPQFTFQQYGEEIQFDQLLDEGVFVEFEWVFGDDSSPSYEYEPSYIYEGEGDYYVTLTAWDDAGCSNSYNGVVNIYPTLLFYSPTVFSPNGDGVNDAFKVSVVGYSDFELIVFDRWGKQVFSTTDPLEGWDGKYKNGQPAPQDVYMYKAYLGNTESDEKIEKGRVSIIK
tara:strand:+ start:805 stop:3675 length:2871 start_codon:yes stop_codon:yes gene_type:complete